MAGSDEMHTMPKQPPAPVHIRIDTQEQRSGIPALLAAMPQVYIEVTPLRIGDYDVGGDPCRCRGSVEPPSKMRLR